MARITQIKVPNDNTTYNLSIPFIFGAGTTATQKITIGTNDKVTAVTGIGTAQAAGQTFTGTTESYTVYPTE